MKSYHYEFFVDFPEDNHIDKFKRVHANIDINADTLRESLYILCNVVFDCFDTNKVLIGLKHHGCTCDGKEISESYRNRMINEDVALRTFMWC